MRVRVGTLGVLAALLLAAAVPGGQEPALEEDPGEEDQQPELDGDPDEGGQQPELDAPDDESEPEADPMPATGEAELEDAGWWWYLQTGVVDLPPPPSVPEDGLMVGNGADGSTAVAAVRYLLEDDDISGATLTLEVASEQGGEAAGIRACPAIARWRGAQAGAWEQRPGSDCEEGEVAGTRDEDGETWTFELAPLADNGMINVILQPGALEAPEEAEGSPDAEDPAAPETAEEDEPSAPFQVAFEPPEDASLAVVGGFGADGDFDAPDPSGPGEAPDAEQAPDVEDSAALDMDQSASSPPAEEGASEADAPEVAESQPPREEESTTLVAPEDDGQQSGTQEPVAMQEVGFGQDPIRQIAALLALACGLAALVLWRAPTTGGGTTGLAGLRPSLIVRPDQAARHLQADSVAEQSARGLGRFRRARTGEPPPL